jgi:hypothetical protein
MLALCGACGPIEYVNQVTRKASTEVEAARAVKADKHAPYWYTLAIEYLHKAREEAASADYQAANRFGRKAEHAARRARAEAIERARNPRARRRVRPATPTPAPASPTTPDEVDATEHEDNPLDEIPATEEGEE